MTREADDAPLQEGAKAEIDKECDAAGIKETKDGAASPLPLPPPD